MADIISVEAVNFQELTQALTDAPELTFTYVKQEMQRFGARFRRQFIRDWMSGTKATGPTAKAVSAKFYGGKFVQGKSNKNIQGFGTGSNLNELRTVLKLSRMLRIHAEGATITAHGGGFLYLSRKSGKAGAGKIIARRRSVTIPKRLPFVEQSQRQFKDDLIPRIENAMQRAMRVAFERRMRALGNLGSMVANF